MLKTLLETYLFCVSVVFPQIVEPFTAHYVFALGIARFLSCAHWVLQVRHEYMNLISESYCVIHLREKKGRRNFHLLANIV